MAGADSWVYRNGFRRFSKWWWREWLWVIPRRVPTHLWQRIRRGYSDYDMYNGGHFIADQIANTAWWMFSQGHSYPMDTTEDEWNLILLELRDEFTNAENDIDWSPSDMAFDLLHERFRDLWD